jgi:hypothetical protein
MDDNTAALPHSFLHILNNPILKALVNKSTTQHQLQQPPVLPQEQMPGSGQPFPFTLPTLRSLPESNSNQTNILPASLPNLPLPDPQMAALCFEMQRQQLALMTGLVQRLEQQQQQVPLGKPCDTVKRGQPMTEELKNENNLLNVCLLVGSSYLSFIIANFL